MTAYPARGIPHTPGPWSVDPVDWDMVTSDQDGLAIATLDHPDRSDDDNLANARLIAAAPELLSMLQDAYADLSRISDNQSGISDEDLTDIAIPDMTLLDQIRITIAKAKGE